MFNQYHHYKAPALILLGLLVLTIWPYLQMAEPHDSQRVASIVLISGILIVRLWYTKLSVAFIWAIGAVFIWGLLAVWQSPMPFWSSLEFAMLFSTFLLSAVLMPKVNALQIKHIACIFVIMQVYYLTHHLTNYLAIMLNSESMHPYNLITGFSNIRFYAQFLIWTVPFVIAALAVYPELRYRQVIIFVTMLNWAYQFLTSTRAFFLAMLVTIPIVWLLTKNTKPLRLQYLKWLFISALGGGVIYLVMLLIIPSFFGVSVDASLSVSTSRDMLNSSGRIYLWQEALRLMSEQPWLGAGPMMTAMLVDLKTSAHPHNFVLQLLAEWGIPFTFTLLFFSAIGLLRWKKLINISSIERVPLALPVAAALSAGIAAGMVDGLIVMPVSLIYMTIIIGLLAGLWRTWTPEVARVSISKWLIPIFAAPAVYLAVYSISMWPERNIAAEDRKPIIGKGYRIIQDNNPRFWVMGHIALPK